VLFFYIACLELYFCDLDENRLLQGLNARLELINKHPFYHQQAFDQSKGSDFEAWKLSELEVCRGIAPWYGCALTPLGAAGD
jgi:hypothetical protein